MATNKKRNKIAQVTFVERKKNNRRQFDEPSYLILMGKILLILLWKYLRNENSVGLEESEFEFVWVLN